MSLLLYTISNWSGQVAVAVPLFCVNIGTWMHSQSPSNLMYKSVPNTTNVTSEDLVNAFSDVIRKGAGTSYIEGTRGGDVKNKGQQFLMHIFNMTKNYRQLACGIIIWVFFFSCKSDKIDFSVGNDLFKIRWPTKPIMMPNSNTFNGSFLLDADTFYYNVGFNIHNLSESCVQAIFTNDSTELMSSSNEVVYVADKHFDRDRLRKRNLDFFVANGYNVKMVYPIDTAQSGLIGIYVDSLLNTKLGNVKMNLFCNGKHKSSENIKKSLRNVVLTRWDTTKIEIPLGSYFVN